MPLHLKILLGMLLGVLVGVAALLTGLDWLVVDWIKPFGVIFIKALKVIAVPLIVASLIKGVSDLKDLSKLSSMGGRTVVLYLFTTAVAVTVGIIIATAVGPGRGLDQQTRDQLVAASGEAAEGKNRAGRRAEGARAAAAVGRSRAGQPDRSGRATIARCCR